MRSCCGTVCACCFVCQAIHAALVHEAAFDESRGPGSTGTSPFAKLGSSGKHKQNIERDLVRSCERITGARFEPCYINTWKVDWHTGLLKEYLHPVMYMPDVLHDIWDAGPAKFESTFGISRVHV